jgi:hypothetical protein
MSISIKSLYLIFHAPNDAIVDLELISCFTGYQELAGYRKEYRSNTRVIVPNVLIADEIWKRVKSSSFQIFESSQVLFSVPAYI